MSDSSKRHSDYFGVCSLSHEERLKRLILSRQDDKFWLAHCRAASTFEREKYPQASALDSPCGGLERRLREGSFRNVNTISLKYVSVSYIMQISLFLASGDLRTRRKSVYGVVHEFITCSNACMNAVTTCWTLHRSLHTGLRFWPLTGNPWPGDYLPWSWLVIAPWLLIESKT